MSTSESNNTQVESSERVRVLLALDESDASIRAAAVAQQLFADAELLAINVSEEPLTTAPSLGWGMVAPWPYPAAMLPVGVDDAGTIADDRLDQARDMASDAARQGGARSVEPIGGIGDVADAIVAAASEHRVDVVVVGWSDKGWFSRLVDGSVSRDVVRKAEVPVLVAK